MYYDIYKIQHDLLGRLDEKRFYHSLGVQGISFALALQYGYDADKANIAGLLHDVAKCLSDQDLLSECVAYSLDISEVERKNPFLLHGKLGAYYAKLNYGINDESILSAISYHTTGKPNMSLLEKIIFTADYIEPNRSPKKIPELDDIRILAFKDLDRAVLKILENTLLYLKEANKEIDTLTVDTYEYYKNKVI
jgi:predicted HD superfamily hydrolase involved in NAD metabolism